MPLKAWAFRGSGTKHRIKLFICLPGESSCETTDVFDYQRLYYELFAAHDISACQKCEEYRAHHSCIHSHTCHKIAVAIYCQVTGLTWSSFFFPPSHCVAKFSWDCEDLMVLWLIQVYEEGNLSEIIFMPLHLLKCDLKFMTRCCMQIEQQPESSHLAEPELVRFHLNEAHISGQRTNMVHVIS